MQNTMNQIELLSSLIALKISFLEALLINNAKDH